MAFNIENFVEKLSLYKLTMMASILDIRAEIDLWHDDEWRDKEDALRVEVAEAMMEAGK